MKPDTQSRRTLLAMLLLALGFVAPAGAADAIFSADGSKVYRLDSLEPGALVVHDTAVKSKRLIKLRGLPENAQLKALLRGAKGELLLLTDAALWEWQPDGAITKKRFAAPQGVVFQEVALVPPKQILVFSVYWPDGDPALGQRFGAMTLRPGQKQLSRLALRRVDHVVGLSALANGELFFSADGDLWHGELTEEGDGFDFPQFSLTGYRCTPLATRETFNGTPAQHGVHQTALTENYIYVFVNRMGGSDTGRVLRMARSEKLKRKADDEFFPLRLDFDERVALYREMLGSVELGGQGARAFLCASPDRKSVFYLAEGEPYLLRDGSKRVKLSGD